MFVWLISLSSFNPDEIGVFAKVCRVFIMFISPWLGIKAQTGLFRIWGSLSESIGIFLLK
jgi:hypothetical protein